MFLERETMHQRPLICKGRLPRRRGLVAGSGTAWVALGYLAYDFVRYDYLFYLMGGGTPSITPGTSYDSMGGEWRYYGCLFEMIAKLY